MPRTPSAPTPSTDFLAHLEMLDLATLRPHPRNDGSHPPDEIAHLRASIREHDIYRNVVVAQDGTTLAGHGVILAAQAEGKTHVPGYRMPYGPDDPRALKLLVGDNHMARLREQDDAVLAALLSDLAVDGVQALLGTGYDEASMQALLDSVSPGNGLGGGNPEADVEPEIDRAQELQEQWGTALGQIWACGPHRVCCGDATDAAILQRLMGDDKAVLCHADPPYGMGKENEGIANDNLYASKLDAFQMQWWKAARPFLADNASVYIWGNAEDLWRLWYVGGLQASERMTYRNELVWDKGDAGAGGISHQGAEGFRCYPSATERCLFFMLGEQGFSTNADNYWEGWKPLRDYLHQERQRMGWNARQMKEYAGGTGNGHGDHWTGYSQWMMPTRDNYEGWQRAAQGDGFKRDYEGFKRDYDDLKRDYDDLKRDYYATRAYFDNTHDLMTDVWQHARVKGEERHDHPTPKPLALIVRMVKSSTPVGGLVYEPFLGSGTTLVACENLGRICRGVELDPGFLAITLQRWTDLTGQTPSLVR